MKEEKLCSKCGKNPAEELHPCPYKSEMNAESMDEDDLDLCDCCVDCRGDCVMSV